MEKIHCQKTIRGGAIQENIIDLLVSSRVVPVGDQLSSHLLELFV